RLCRASERKRLRWAQAIRYGIHVSSARLNRHSRFLSLSGQVTQKSCQFSAPFPLKAVPCGSIIRTGSGGPAALNFALQATSCALLADRPFPSPKDHRGGDCAIENMDVHNSD